MLRLIRYLLTDPDATPEERATAALLVDRIEHATGTPQEPDYLTGPELMRQAASEPRWAVEGLVAEGVSLLAGAPKVGKSWMALDMALAVATGKLFLNRATTAGRCLYCALEDSPRRLRLRLQVMGERRLPGTLTFATRFPKMDEGGMDALVKWADGGNREHGAPALIILDTWGKVQPANALAYAGSYSAIEELKHWSEDCRIPVLLVHHQTKTGAGKNDDPLSAIAGSTGLIGAVDNILMLNRERETGRGIDTETFPPMLYRTGRDVEEGATELAFMRGRWHVIGESGE